MTITKAVAYRLSIILKDKKLSKNDLKSIPGVKPESVNNIFRTKGTPAITLMTLYRICCALDMTLSEFMDDPVFEQVEI